MSEELFTIADAESKTLKVVFIGVDEVRYEGGWWMKRHDYDSMWRIYPSWGGRTVTKVKREDVGIDRNEDTKQLTIFFIPLDL